MTDFTLEDLAADGAETASEESGGGGDWIPDLIDKLDEKGLLDALITGEMPGRDTTVADGGVPAEVPSEVSDTAPDLDARKVKQIMLKVYDNAALIPGLSEEPTLKEMITLLDEKEEVANKMMGQYL